MGVGKVEEKSNAFQQNRSAPDNKTLPLLPSFFPQRNDYLLHKRTLECCENKNIHHGKQKPQWHNHFQLGVSVARMSSSSENLPREIPPGAQLWGLEIFCRLMSVSSAQLGTFNVKDETGSVRAAVSFSVLVLCLSPGCVRSARHFFCCPGKPNERQRGRSWPSRATIVEWSSVPGSFFPLCRGQFKQQFFC